MQPPLLPIEALARVLRLARLDGTSVLVLSGAFALVSALTGDGFGTGIGLVIAGAGAIELHGVGLLRAGEFRGVRWLIMAQVLLLLVILAYCGLRLQQMDLSALQTAFDRAMTYPLFRDAWQVQEELGITKDEFLIQNYRLTYRLVAFLTLCFQGGMIWYYLRRREIIRAALAAE